jgi:hypothetical protein
VTDHTAGRFARAVLAALTAFLVTAGLLAIAGAPARAADDDVPGGPTYLTCTEQRPAKGRLVLVRPAGPGAVWVAGWVTPCKRPSPRDAAMIAWVGKGFGEVAGGPSAVYYRRPGTRYFSRVVTVDPLTRRVCLADTPDHAVDCFAVRVPTEADGELGVPVVGGRTTTAKVSLNRYFPWCGSCW